MRTPTDSRDLFCPAEGHPLQWLTDKFALCPVCDLLFCRQPGSLVWIYDPWAKSLADELARVQMELHLHQSAGKDAT